MHYEKYNKKLVSLQLEAKTLKDELNQVRAEKEEVKEILNSTLHEVRRFSAQLMKLSERLSRETSTQPSINQSALSVFYTAGMISSRLAYTDLELNPRALESQTTIRSGIYKKFDKAKKILSEESRDKDIGIRLLGESRYEIDALPVFELLPFVLIENAIKYSPQNQNIDISFEQVSGKPIVTVASFGPSVSADELPHLFEKGFRGCATKSIAGDGLGLFLAKRVCDYHGISIRAETGAALNYQISGRSYFIFKVTLEF